MEPGRDRKLVTTALLLGMFLAALEATAVATAMPTAVGELGGIGQYSWVFSAYLLTSTTTVPLYGKLADLYGRRKVYLVAVALFLLGSALSGAARSVDQLIFFRALQGLGAGGVMPVAITLVGDIFTLQERARMQGLFSGVWGVSSIVGPAAGGVITDTLSWRWVFYINVPFGIASAVTLWIFLRERSERREHRLDIVGTVTLTAALTALMLGLLEGEGRWGWGDPRTLITLGAALAGIGLFLRQEARAAEPILPLDLFRNRVIAISSAGSLLIGTLLFTTSAFVPMFAQGVLGGTAIDAGMVLAPMSIGWPIASTLSGHLLLRFGYRPLVILGGALILAGTTALAVVTGEQGAFAVAASMLVVGFGLGFMSTPYLVAVQNAVPWSRRGVATSSVQFFRTIGGAVSIAALGALLGAGLQSRLGAGATVNAALDASARAALDSERLLELVDALSHALHWVFIAIAAIGVCALIVALLFPAGSTERHAHASNVAGAAAQGAE